MKDSVFVGCLSLCSNVKLAFINVDEKLDIGIVRGYILRSNLFLEVEFI